MPEPWERAEHTREMPGRVKFNPPVCPGAQEAVDCQLGRTGAAEETRPGLSCCFMLKTNDLRELVQRWNNLAGKSVLIRIEDE